MSKEAESMEMRLRKWHKDMGQLMEKLATLPPEVRTDSLKARLDGFDRLISETTDIINRPKNPPQPECDIVREWDLIAVRKLRVAMAAMLGVPSN